MSQDIAHQPLAGLKGVGPQLAGKLAARGLATLQDLWLHLPLRHEDRTRITPIRQLRGGVAAQVGVKRTQVAQLAVGDVDLGLQTRLLQLQRQQAIRPLHRRHGLAEIAAGVEHVIAVIIDRLAGAVA